MRLRKSVSALAVALITVVSALVALPSASAATSEAAAANRIYSLINSYRANSGLAPLAWNPQIGAVAQNWTAGSATTAELAGAYSFGHNGSLPAGYPAGSQGWSENIVWNYDVDQAFYWWVNSAPHNANMLNASFTDIGIGAVRLTAGPNSGAYMITADFAKYPAGMGGGQPAVDDAAEKAAAEKAAAEKAAAEKAAADKAAADKAAADRAAAEKAAAEKAAADKAAAEKAAADKAAADKAAADKAAADKAAADKAAAGKAAADKVAAGKAAADKVAADRAAADKAAADRAAADKAAAEKAAADKAAAEKAEPVIVPAAPETPAAPVPTPVTDVPVPDGTQAPAETVEEPAAEPVLSEAVNPAPEQADPAAAKKPAAEKKPVATAPVADPADATALTEATRGGFEATAHGSLLTLSGLTPNASYRVVLHSTPMELGTLTADAQGTLAIEVPADLPAGDHRVALSNGSFTGWQPFSVEAPVTVLGSAVDSGTDAGAATAATAAGAAGAAGAADGQLAATGLASWQLLTALLGALFVAAGTAAVVVVRRRDAQA